MRGQREPASDLGLGRKVVARQAPQGEQWLPVAGAPHLRRSSTTGRLRTYIPANEAANPAYGWPNWHHGFPVIETD